MDGLPQGPGALAVDDGYGLQFAHDGGGNEVFHHALRLQCLHPSDVQFPGGRGPQGPVRVLANGDRGVFFLAARSSSSMRRTSSTLAFIFKIPAFSCKVPSLPTDTTSAGV